MRDVARGAELWGYVERVTNLGAYVNVGAEVPGFLLLKEIPGRPKVSRFWEEVLGGGGGTMC